MTQKFTPLESLASWLLHHFGPGTPEGREAQVALVAMKQRSKPREMLVSAYVGPDRNAQVPLELRSLCERWTDELTEEENALYDEHAPYGHFATARWHPDVWAWSTPVHDSNSHIVVHASHRDPLRALPYLYALLDLEFGS